MRRLQGSVAESVRVPFARFRQFDDFLCCGGAERIIPPSLLEWPRGSFVRDPQETNRLGVKLMALQVSLCDRKFTNILPAMPIRHTLSSTGMTVARIAFCGSSLSRRQNRGFEIK